MAFGEANVSVRVNAVKFHLLHASSLVMHKVLYTRFNYSRPMLVHVASDE